MYPLCGSIFDPAEKLFGSSLVIRREGIYTIAFEGIEVIGGKRVVKKSTAKGAVSTQKFKVIKGTEYLSPESQKSLADRLARAEGHLAAVRRMVLEHRCADEVLLQVAAVKAAINQVAAVIVDHEMKACIKYCMQGDVDMRLERTLRVLSTILKQT